MCSFGRRNVKTKDNQWYFGLNVRSGADIGSRYAHTSTGTFVNIHDVNEAEYLIRVKSEKL